MDWPSTEGIIQMPKVSDDHRERRKNQIVDAAKRCFSRKGFHRTTTREICEEAGLSTGAVYSYFDSKEELIQAVAEGARSDVQAMLRTHEDTESTENEIERLVGWMDSVLHALEASDEAVQTAEMDIRLRSEALDTEPLRLLVVDAMTDWRETLGAVVEEGQAYGEVDERLNPKSVAELLLLMVVGVQLAVALDLGVDLTSLRKSCRKLVAAGLSGDVEATGASVEKTGQSPSG